MYGEVITKVLPELHSTKSLSSFESAVLTGAVHGNTNLPSIIHLEIGYKVDNNELEVS
jgi:hypothetical protein